MNASDELAIYSVPRLREGRLLIGLEGWMDGGNVSTGTLEWLAEALDGGRVAEIRPDNFYLYAFPGSMELTALFRPHAHIAGGMIAEYEPPEAPFLAVPKEHLLLLRAREPNLHWDRFARHILNYATQCGVTRIIFIGSVAGAVPHTREPRLSASVSDETLKPLLEPYGIRFSEYEGPASFITHLNVRARERGIGLISLVAEIPAYVQGANPKCIESVIRKLAGLLSLPVTLDPLREMSEQWEKRVNEVLEDEEELSAHIERLEQDYDHDVFDTQMGDLKRWLESRGLRVD